MTAVSACAASCSTPIASTWRISDPEPAEEQEDVADADPIGLKVALRRPGYPKRGRHPACEKEDPIEIQLEMDGIVGSNASASGHKQGYTSERASRRFPCSVRPSGVART